LCAHARDTDRLVSIAEEILERQANVQLGQIVGIVAGTRTRSGSTNFMRLHMIGDRRAAKTVARKTKKRGQ
jgi:pyruvate kinase